MLEETFGAFIRRNELEVEKELWNEQEEIDHRRSVDCRLEGNDVFWPLLFKWQVYVEMRRWYSDARAQ